MVELRKENSLREKDNEPCKVDQPACPVFGHSGAVIIHHRSGNRQLLFEQLVRDVPRAHALIRWPTQLS